MISKSTKDRIVQSSRIEEVVGDFVVLKKRGTNLIGLCPFHNEKTPSFNVNPPRNIFKCFGCGKAGDPITFIMEHEKLSYPAALKYLANKYQVEIEEENVSDEEKIKRQEEENEIESLMIVSSYAQKYFSDTLHEHSEGKAIGLSYFHERGFRDETIKKFQLGYSPEERHTFSKAAIEAGYQTKYLVKSGLCFLPEEYSVDAESSKEKLLDRFRGRVLFPIHNVTGRVIAFGGRILGSDKKTAKYINSPESEIYHKSHVLYGIFFARNEIVAKDNCLLVEGYTDVISLHQAGIENVVASSGTALTTEQIRLIGRYTKNITILFDGDTAGIKASMRGIDMILSEGLNVKIVLFADGEDPDSFARKRSKFEVQEFIDKNAKDFILFKAGLLLEEAANDPVRKAAMIRNIVESIALISDAIVRAEYTKLLSVKMQIGEQVLISEMNKVRGSIFKKSAPNENLEALLPETTLDPQVLDENTSESQELDIIRLLINSGHESIAFETQDGESREEVSLRVSEFLLQEIEADGIEFESPLYALMYKEFRENIDQFIDSENPNDAGQRCASFFISHSDPDVRNEAANITLTSHQLSDNWKVKFNIHVPLGDILLRKDVLSSIYSLKKKKLQNKMEELLRNLGDEPSEDDYTEIQIRKIELDRIKIELGKIKGTVVW